MFCVVSRYVKSSLEIVLVVNSVVVRFSQSRRSSLEYCVFDR